MTVGTGPIGTVREASTSGAEVEEVLKRLAAALHGERIETAIAGMLSFALITMWHEISEDDVVAGVKDVSGYMVMWLDGKVNPVDPARAN